MELFLLTGLCIVYTSMVLWFTRGVHKTPLRSPLGSARPSVSVIVPLRNEEDNLIRTLSALDRQDYDGLWEVICVNDRSTDQTPQLLAKFCQVHPRFRLIHIAADSPPVASPKKRALEQGFQVAQHSILMTMDADCLPPKGWLRSMASRFDPGIGIVQGPKRVGGLARPLHGYQRLETLGLTAVEAAGFTQGHPMVASAAALAYRKELFFKVGGFSDLMNLASGDDDMLVHKMASEPVDILYNLDPAAAVVTGPVDSWSGLLNQRARWASNGTHYRNHAYTFFLSLIYTFFCWLLLSPILVICGCLPWTWFVGPFLIKVAVDLLFLSVAAKRLQQGTDLRWYPLLALVNVPLVAIAVPLGIFKLFRWK